MTLFKIFKNQILSLPKEWQNKDKVYFSQLKDGYSAAYKPYYPKSSYNDMIINTIDKSGAYKRGNFELIIFLQDKFTALYFESFEQLKKYIEKELIQK